MSAKIGSTVLYVSTKGQTKVGLVVATAETLVEGTALSEQITLTGSQVNLVVFSASGAHYPRYQVPSEAEVADNIDFKQGGFYREI